MAAVTSTISINAAFLQEIKEDHQELWHLLHLVSEACHGERSPSATRREMADLMGRLRDQLALHFSLEEAFGYFEDPISVAPRLCRDADQLRGQHRELFLAVCDLVEQAEQLLYHETNACPPRRLIGGFNAFHRSLLEHEARENELILQAFDDDIGVGD